MAIIYTTWNPDDKHADITLSGDNLVASCTVSWKAVRTIVGKPSGKWYWEITIDDNTYVNIGVGTSAATLANYPGADNYGCGMDRGSLYSQGAGLFTQHVPATASPINGDIISVAFDMDGGGIYFALNGVWAGTSNPAAATDPTFTFTPGITLYPMMGIQTSQVTANFGASAFSHSVPSGFNSGLYSGTPETFTFINPTPAHLSTVYGTTEQVCLTTTISGEEPEYIYDAAFYDEFDVQIGTTVLGIQSGQSAESNVCLNTPSGIDYGWYMTATSSGSEDTSDTYTFHNRFLYEGYVTENDSPISRKVNLYYRSTGELIDTTTSSGSNGYYKLSAVNNDTHFIVAFDDEAGEDYNALILDKLLPVGSE